jgi:predicted Fe-Mo cluster-binding NifX family protein
MSTTVAIPRFRDIVAPCFEVARYFLIARVEAGQVLSRETIQCSGCKGFGRVALLRDQQVDLLICSGIKGFYRDMLKSIGVETVADFSGTVDEILAAYLEGKVAPISDSPAPMVTERPIPLEDLICWTRELFTSHGYTIHPGEEKASFPVDLVAEIKCPVCQKPVRVAICCGAHAYRRDQEIRELNNSARADFHARVYVHPASEQIAQYCREYGIELLDPNAGYAHTDHPVTDRIPILQGVVVGHEEASGPGRPVK